MVVFEHTRLAYFHRMNQIVANVKEKPTEKIAALLWCLDKQGVHFSRSCVLGGVIIMLKVFNLKLGDTGFLPFKFGPKDTSVVVGILGILMMISLLAVVSYQGRIDNLRKLSEDQVIIALMGKHGEKPTGILAVILSLTMIVLGILLCMVASYSFPDIKALLTAVFFQKA